MIGGGGGGAAEKPPSSNTDGGINQLESSNSWSEILRPILNVVVPCFYCHCHPFYYFFLHQFPFATSPPPQPSTLTGTILCPVNASARVRLCLQRTPRGPISFLLELPLRTSDFASLVKLGTTRMVFTGRELPGDTWAMLCNGKRVGVAWTKEAVEKDKALLRMIDAVSTGVGMLPAGSDGLGGGYKYLRGQFERVVGPEAESVVYHLVDPAGCLGQDLSLFFMRRR